MAPWDVITFDCYGTLINWEPGIRAAFDGFARTAGVGVDLDSALRIYHEEEPVVESMPYRPYREVLRQTAHRTATRLGMETDGPWVNFLSQSLPHWPPFPDTNAALLRLAAAGLRLGILSNVDDDLMAGSRNQMADVFNQDLIVTAQQVRSYKPAHRHFLVARDKVGNRRWLHVAASCFHDVKPATEVGVPVVWVNRKRESLASGCPAPLAIVSTLAELADWLGIEQGSAQ